MPEDWQHHQMDHQQIDHQQMEECKSAIMTLNIAFEMVLVGEQFMKRYQTIFDRDHDRVGLANNYNKV